MKFFIVGVLFWFSFNFILCLPSCTSCNERKRKRLERQVTIPNDYVIEFDNATNDTIERPAYLYTTFDPYGNSNKNEVEDQSTNNINNHSKKTCRDCKSGLRKPHKHVGCICALFATSSPLKDDRPLISKAIRDVSCHEYVSEEEACTRACLSLALVYYKDKDNMICSHSPNAMNLTVSLHSKVYEKDSKFVYTGLSTNKPTCCDMGTAVLCVQQSQGFKD